MSRVLIIIPYLGGLNPFQQFCIRTLASIKELRVALISDRVDEVRNFLESPVEVFDFLTHFDGSKVGIGGKEMLGHPYKLTDLKPFIDLTFPRIADGAPFVGFSDIDCVFNSDKLAELIRAIAEANARETIFGDRGHLMIFGDTAREVMQNGLFEIFERVRKHQQLNLFDPTRHFALDEFLFLHPVLDRLQDCGRCTWNKDYFRPHLDLPYKRCIPLRRELAGRYLHSSPGENRGNILRDNVYVHLQKRLVKMSQPDSEELEDGLSFALNTDGTVSAGLQRTNFIPNENDFLLCIRYSLHLYWKLAKGRMKNHALRRRPHLSTDLIAEVLQGSESLAP